MHNSETYGNSFHVLATESNQLMSGSGPLFILKGVLSWHPIAGIVTLVGEIQYMYVT